jgi:ribosomal protein S12 methylthiotransferase accessory factor
VQLQEMTEQNHTKAFNANLALMYSQETLDQAQKLLSRESRYFGLNNLGANMEGSEMHKQLLAAYAKVNAKKQ